MYFARRIYQKSVIALLRPITINEYLGSGRLYKYLVGHSERDWLWRNSCSIVAQDKRTGYSNNYNLTWWSDRLSFFLGRWYDLSTQLIIEQFVKPGQTAIDIGANRGNFSLCAAKQVGAEGKVLAFEPNPVMTSVIRSELVRNAITNIKVYEFGLSDTEAELLLSIPDMRAGEASFGRPAEGQKVALVKAKVKKGDDILSSIHVDFIKIDVEGFECRVLAGIEGVITRNKPLVLTEVVEAHLMRSGFSVKSLRDIMTGHGYKGHVVKFNKQKNKIYFTPFTNNDANSDVIWIPSKSRNENE